MDLSTPKLTTETALGYRRPEGMGGLLPAAVRYILTPRTEFRLAAAAAAHLEAQILSLEEALRASGGPYLHGKLLSVDDCRFAPQLHSAIVALQGLKKYELDTGPDASLPEATVLVDGKKLGASAMLALAVADGEPIPEEDAEQAEAAGWFNGVQVRYPAVRRYLNALRRHPNFPHRSEESLLSLHEVAVDAFVAGQLEGSRVTEDSLARAVNWAVRGPRWRLSLSVTLVETDAMYIPPPKEEEDTAEEEDGERMDGGKTDDEGAGADSVQNAQEKEEQKRANRQKKKKKKEKKKGKDTDMPQPVLVVALGNESHRLPFASKWAPLALEVGAPAPVRLQLEYIVERREAEMQSVAGEMPDLGRVGGKLDVVSVGRAEAPLGDWAAHGRPRREDRWLAPTWVAEQWVTLRDEVSTQARGRVKLQIKAKELYLPTAPPPHETDGAATRLQMMQSNTAGSSGGMIEYLVLNNPVRAQAGDWRTSTQELVADSLQAAREVAEANGDLPPLEPEPEPEPEPELEVLRTVDRALVAVGISPPHTPLLAAGSPSTSPRAPVPADGRHLSPPTTALYPEHEAAAALSTVLNASQELHHIQAARWLAMVADVGARGLALTERAEAVVRALTGPFGSGLEGVQRLLQLPLAHPTGWGVDVRHFVDALHERGAWATVEAPAICLGCRALALGAGGSGALARLASRLATDGGAAATLTVVDDVPERLRRTEASLAALHTPETPVTLACMLVEPNRAQARHADGRALQPFESIGMDPDIIDLSYRELQDTVKSMGLPQPLTAAAPILQQAIMRFRKSLDWGFGAEAYSHLPFRAEAFDLLVLHPRAQVLRCWEPSELLRLLRPGGSVQLSLRQWPRDIEKPGPLAPGVKPLRDAVDVCAALRAVGFARVSSRAVRAQSEARLHAFFPCSSLTTGLLHGEHASTELGAQMATVGQLTAQCEASGISVATHLECTIGGLGQLTEETEIVIFDTCHVGEGPDSGSDVAPPLDVEGWPAEQQAAKNAAAPSERRAYGKAVATALLHAAPNVRLIVVNASADSGEDGSSDPFCATLFDTFERRATVVGWRTPQLRRVQARHFLRAVLDDLSMITEEFTLGMAMGRADTRQLMATLHHALAEALVGGQTPAPEAAWFFVDPEYIVQQQQAREQQLAARAADAAAPHSGVQFGLTDQQQQRQRQNAVDGARSRSKAAAAPASAGRHLQSAPALAPSITLVSAEVHRPLVADPNCELLGIESTENLTQATQAFQRATKQLEIAENSRASMRRDKTIATATAKLAKAKAVLERAQAAAPVLRGRLGDTSLQLPAPDREGIALPIGYTEPWGEDLLRVELHGQPEPPPPPKPATGTGRRGGTKNSPLRNAKSPQRRRAQLPLEEPEQERDSGWSRLRGSKGITGVDFPAYWTHPADDSSMYFELTWEVPTQTPNDVVAEGADHVRGSTGNGDDRGDAAGPVDDAATAGNGSGSKKRSSPAKEQRNRAGSSSPGNSGERQSQSPSRPPEPDDAAAMEAGKVGPELLVGWAAAGGRLEECTHWDPQQHAEDASDEGQQAASALRGIGAGVAAWVSSSGGSPCCSLPHATGGYGEVDLDHMSTWQFWKSGPLAPTETHAPWVHGDAIGVALWRLGGYGLADECEVEYFRNGAPLGGAMRFTIPSRGGPPGSVPLYPTFAGRGGAKFSINFGRQAFRGGLLPSSTDVRCLFRPLAPPPDIEVPGESADDKRARLLAETKERTAAKRAKGRAAGMGGRGSLSPERGGGRRRTSSKSPENPKGGKKKKKKKKKSGAGGRGSPSP